MGQTILYSRAGMRLLLALGAVALVSGASAYGVPDDTSTKLAHFKKDGDTHYGVVEDNRVIKIEGSIYGDWERADASYELSEVELLAPTQPSKVFGVALNYKSHVGQTGETEIPEILQLFYKSPTSVVGPGDPIEIPPGASNVHYESELVAVIGKHARNVSVQEADEYVLGITCGNDVTARNWQEVDMQWWRAKGADTFAPCGPYIVSGLDDNDLMIEIRLNGEVEHRQSTRDMVRKIPKIVSFVSQYVTLEPGDLIYTGATGITSRIEPGDEVEVEIEGIGTLKNPVARER